MSSSDQIIQITFPISAKLDRTNFLTWKSQIEPIVHGYGLFEFLSSNTTAPSQELILADKNQPNPAFINWRKQDPSCLNSFLVVPPLISGSLYIESILLSLRLVSLTFVASFNQPLVGLNRAVPTLRKW
jgi:hypothetical protein